MPSGLGSSTARPRRSARAFLPTRSHAFPQVVLVNGRTPGLWRVSFFLTGRAPPTAGEARREHRKSCSSHSPNPARVCALCARAISSIWLCDRGRPQGRIFGARRQPGTGPSFDSRGGAANTIGIGARRARARRAILAVTDGNGQATHAAKTVPIPPQELPFERRKVDRDGPERP